MSEQIDRVIKEYSASLFGRDEDFEVFLLKHFEKIFSEHPLKDMDRFDNTERIKTAGFHEDLSAWRNVYKNIVVSSCLVVSDKQKRFDYKFYFIEEKLDEKTIDIINEALEEVSKFVREFKFKEAQEKVKELLNLIKDRDDRVFNLKLYNEKRNITKAEKKYIRNSARLVELEQIMKESIATDNLDSIIEFGDEIVQVTKDLRKGPLIRKYSKIVDESKNEKKLRRDLARLEQYIAQNRERKNYIAVVIDCSKIIKSASDNKKSILANKYTLVLKEVEEEVEQIKNNIDNIIKESEELINNSQLEEALFNINSQLELLDIIQFKGYEDYEERLLAIRTECVNAQEAEIKLAKDITELDKNLKQRIEENQIFSAKKYCERLIELSETNNMPELVIEYSQMLNQLNRKIEDLKSDIDDIIEECIKMSYKFQFREALSHIIIMLKFIGQNLPSYRNRLEDTKNKIVKAENDYKLLDQEANDLNEALGYLIVIPNYIAALEICKQIISIYKQQKNDKLIESNTYILNQITSKIEELKNNIDILIEETYQLSEDNLFIEALSKIEKGRELLGRQDIPEYKRKLLLREEEILDEQESYIKFIEEYSELEAELDEVIKDKNYILALNKCDLLIHIYELLNKPEEVKKYNEIYDEINEEINKVKDEVNNAIIKSDKLIANYEFAEALSTIDEILQKMEERYFPVYSRTLDFKRQEIITKLTGYEQFFSQIETLEKEVEILIKNKNYVAALMICEDLIYIAELSKNQEYIKKFNKKLEEINAEIAKMKNKIKNLIEEARKLITQRSFEEALLKVELGEEIIGYQDLPIYKRKLTKVKNQIIELQEYFAKGEVKIKKSSVKKTQVKKTPAKKVKKAPIAERKVSKKKESASIKPKSKTSCIRTSSNYYPNIRWTPIRRMMKDAGADIVACNAVIELIEWMGKSAENITKTALMMAKHSKRKTISKHDIIFAEKYLKK